MPPLSPDIPPLPLHEREELASVASVRRVHSDSQVARLRNASEVQQAEQRRHQARSRHEPPQRSPTPASPAGAMIPCISGSMAPISSITLSGSGP